MQWIYNTSKLASEEKVLEKMYVRMQELYKEKYGKYPADDEKTYRQSMINKVKKKYLEVKEK